MTTPKDTDQFLVDAERGIHYHAAGCQATTYSPLAKYVELSYGEIRAIRTHKGELFIAHGCVQQMRAMSKPEIDRWAKQLSERKTVLKIACSYCKRDMGEKDGQGVSGTSHSICPACWFKNYPKLDYPTKPEVTYRGWPGHYILCHRCVFHLNTLIELAGVRVVVSTVGDLRTTDNKMDEVGSGRYYETMAFLAVQKDGYWDADTDKTVAFAGQCSVNRLDKTSDLDAQAMHEAAVRDIADRISKGEELYHATD